MMADHTVYPQQPPFCVQVELSEGCNLRCWFCGLQAISERQGQYKHMTLDTAQQVAQLLNNAKHYHGWNPRVEFAMHGEPTMNPLWVEIISVFRWWNPTLQLMVTSNGGGLLRKPGITHWVDAAFAAGLNILALDDYEGVMICDKVRAGYTGSVPMYDYPANPTANPHRRVRQGEQYITLIKDISVATKGTHSVLNNHAGSAFPKNHSAQGKPCAKPFRELSVRWDGNVAICCNDWRGEFKLGNVVQRGFQAVWLDPRMDAARRHLLRGERTFGPCEGCDALSYRTGLLPDAKGQHKDRLPPPDAHAAALVADACAGPPYSAPVPRPWEQGEPPAHWTEAAQRARHQGTED